MVKITMEKDVCIYLLQEYCAFLKDVTKSSNVPTVQFKLMNKYAFGHKSESLVFSLKNNIYIYIYYYAFEK